jgi:hypothetical protein
MEHDRTGGSSIEDGAAQNESPLAGDAAHDRHIAQGLKTKQLTIMAVKHSVKARNN